MKIQLTPIKKYLATAAFLCLCIGCGSLNQSLQEDFYHDYQETGGQTALVMDTGSITDEGFNQAAYEGTSSYAQAAGVSYSYYNAASDTDEAYEAAVLTAIQNDAKLVICAGSHFEQAVGKLQNEYNDVAFLLLDGIPKDASGKPAAIAHNVHCITYREDEAGYIAGYMAVLDGYRKLGFIGGKEIPSVLKYGYGYLQGINDAAAFLGVSDEISVDYWYADTFSPSQKVEEAALKWYQNGTEVIFTCGGSLYESVLASAETCDGRLIGADVNQNQISELFLTSAMKGIKASIIIALDEFFASDKAWPEGMAGEAISYGAEKKCIELPYTNDEWRFKNVSVDDYFEVLAKLKSGEILVSEDIETQPETTVSVIYHNQLKED